MPERNLRRRVTPIRRAANTSTQISTSRRIRLRKPRRSSERIKVPRRSKSSPSLWDAAGDFAAAEEEEVGVLYRPDTCADIFSNSISASGSPGTCFERYNKDAKVVINVTVEGSPGPIRTMVKLSSNIEEVKKVVVDKYNEEARTPPLHTDAPSMYQLHHSHFSLQCLSKTDLIGDVGSRSFYLRKNSHDDTKLDDVLTHVTEVSPLPFLPTFLNREIKKIIRRTCKVWRILGCISCSG